MKNPACEGRVSHIKQVYLERSEDDEDELRLPELELPLRFEELPERCLLFEDEDLFLLLD